MVGGGREGVGKDRGWTGGGRREAPPSPPPTDGQIEPWSNEYPPKTGPGCPQLSISTHSEAPVTGGPSTQTTKTASTT